MSSPVRSGNGIAMKRLSKVLRVMFSRRLRREIARPVLTRGFSERQRVYRARNRLYAALNELRAARVSLEHGENDGRS